MRTKTVTIPLAALRRAKWSASEREGAFAGLADFASQNGFEKFSVRLTMGMKYMIAMHKPTPSSPRRAE